MTKLTAKQIDERSIQAMGAYVRALERGDIDQKTYDEGVKELARWSIAQYSKLPQAQAFEAITNLLLDLKQ